MTDTGVSALFGSSRSRRPAGQGYSRGHSPQAHLGRPWQDPPKAEPTPNTCPVQAPALALARISLADNGCISP